MSTIDDLKAKVDRLRSQLRDAEKSYNDARIAAHPVEVGTVYVNKKGQRAKVMKIVIRYGDPAAILQFFKKDGNLGLRGQVMNHWDGWKAET